MTVTIERTRQALAALRDLPDSALPVEEALQRVVQAADALFGVDSTALMLVDDEQQLRNVAVSDPRVEVLELAHARSGQGPCLEALLTGDTVYSGDLGEEARWPAFTAVARALGLCAVLATAITIPNGGVTVGVVAMLSNQHHPWSDDEREAITAFANLVSALLVKALRASDQERLAAELQHALDGRVLIEQAKGMLVERHGITPAEAFERLRSRARRERRRVAEVAREMIERRTSRERSGPADA